MDYTKLIEKRQSVRAFTDEEVTQAERKSLTDFFDFEKALAPDLDMKFRIVDGDAANRLEGVAGYRGFAFGAPAYMVLLGGESEIDMMNAGYVGENLLLKAVELGLDTCWITVNESSVTKRALLMEEETQKINAIIAIGHGKKTLKGDRLDIVDPSEVRLIRRPGYAAPKMAPEDITYIDTWGNSPEWDEYTVDPVVQDGLYAASLAPTFLNRQPVRYIVDGKRVILCIKKEELVSEDDNLLNIGICMLHFSAEISSNYANAGQWVLEAPDDTSDLGLPDDYRAMTYFQFT
ncbi:MAG: nitroreductase family protein [Lachnospiraceae bacterium]|nr:nitroreductase family protein [Lachnospiraceae bacterium]